MLGLSGAFSNNETQAELIIIFIGSVIFLLIIREITTWYWKINDILENLVEINNKLDKVVGGQHQEKIDYKKIDIGLEREIDEAIKEARMKKSDGLDID